MKKNLQYRAIGFLIMIFAIMVIVSSTINGSIISQHTIIEIDNEKNHNSLKTVFNDPPIEEWNITYGGTSYDLGFSVIQTSDGGFITTGFTRSEETVSDQVVLLKTDANGREEWNRTFGGPDSDGGKSVEQTIDGGYIITGFTITYGTGLCDVWLIKTDETGQEEWNTTFGISNSDGFCFGNSVKQTIDGGYIITGIKQNSAFPNDDIWLIKTDATGQEQWNKTFGGKSGEEALVVEQTNDSGFIIAGWTSSFGEGRSDAWLIKTDSSGSQQWSKTFGGTNFDWFESLEQTKDGGFIITGCTRSFGSESYDTWLMKTDEQGKKQWSKTFGGPETDSGESVKQTVDGGYIIAGYTLSYGQGSEDVWLIKTDLDGIEQWNNTFGGPENDGAYSVEQTSDGGFIITGWTWSYGYALTDLWLIKVEGENKPPTIAFSNPKDAFVHFSGIPLLSGISSPIADAFSLGGFRLRPIQINAIDDKDRPEDLTLELYINDENKGPCIWNTDTEQFEYEWTGWALGTYSIMAKATDTYNAESESVSMDVWNFCFIP